MDNTPTLEAFPRVPAALEASAREVKLMLDRREDLVTESTRIQNRLPALLHDRVGGFSCR